LKKNGSSYKFVSFVLVLILMLSVLAACGGEEEVTPASTATPSPTAVLTATPSPTPPPTPTTTPTPSESKPVKIGAINDWSGPAAVAGLLSDSVIPLVEEQVKEMGGILGGRPIKVVRFDSRSQTAEAAAGVRKLALEDNVSLIVFGGATGSACGATSDAAEEFKILYVDFSPFPSDISQRQYTVRVSYTDASVTKQAVDFIQKVIKPKTVALLAQDDAYGRLRMSSFKQALKDIGSEVQIVSEQYPPLDTMDYSPYLTRVKYDNPDMLYMAFSAHEPYLVVYKQILELGGWGDIKVFSGSATGASASVTKLPGAKGVYQWGLWVPGLPAPGARIFEEAYTKKYNKLPESNHVFFYNALWTAIEAIKLAGTDTDRDKIAQVARSGQLKWDSPAGPAVFGTDGEANLQGYIFQVGEGGKLTKIIY